ncbi:MAG: hypothetical protein RLZZ591_293 [Pseudomonadota bacterium]|jgi:hypothetical protein
MVMKRDCCTKVLRRTETRYTTKVVVNLTFAPRVVRMCNESKEKALAAE